MNFSTRLIISLIVLVVAFFLLPYLGMPHSWFVIIMLILLAVFLLWSFGKIFARP